MDKSTFRALTAYLNPKIQKYQGGRKQVLPHKMVTECFIRVTNYVMKLLKAKSSKIIKWPAKEEYKFVATQFNKKGKRFIL